ncbi:MAG: hypothetical protein D3924_13525, partial [Candidatus Electrothrix sp. AR4]|nr:hypothetical protein [Candidatus Electrothrix sp. AR4]
MKKIGSFNNGIGLTAALCLASLMLTAPVAEAWGRFNSVNIKKNNLQALSGYVGIPAKIQALSEAAEAAQGTADKAEADAAKAQTAADAAQGT